MPGVGGAAVLGPSLRLYRQNRASLQTSISSIPSSVPSSSRRQLVPAPQGRLDSQCVVSSSSLFRGCHSGRRNGLWRAGANLSHLPSTAERCGREGEGATDEEACCTSFLAEGDGFALDAVGDGFHLCLEQRSGWLILSAFSVFLGFGGAALADDEVVPVGETDPVQYVLGVLFFVAVFALAILTAGVIYLSVSEFLEKRQQADQQKSAKEEKTEKTETVKVGSAKGFGTKKVDKSKE